MLTTRTVWTGDQFHALATHPDPEVRMTLAEAVHISADQRATLVEDPEFRVLATLAEGPDAFVAFTWEPLPPPLPEWAYHRLLERSPRLGRHLIHNPWLPRDLRNRLLPSRPTEPPQAPEPAEVRAASGVVWTRAAAAAEPELSADVVARLAIDPAPEVRLAVSMRAELSEAERAAIDYHVGPDDRIVPAAWAARTRDPEQQRRCAFSAHIGLRRSAAVNPHLPPDLIRVLAADDDFAVRLLLCERHDDVPPQTVLDTFLEARTMTRGRLLTHPSFPSTGLARLADSPDPQVRALAVRDPDATTDLIDRLSRDPDPSVRCSTAADPRLSPTRVLELFDDPETTGRAAAGPHLPITLMNHILTSAAVLDTPAADTTQPAIFLGRWSRGDFPTTSTDD
ncbi:hypothetical protein [Actinoplanes utahensis]|uniref:hypothetical protein n=1 Tax=Actinoplanes utahensis TaxID=1869 RepID=UPI00068EC92F|nr:hypothetical protein [Actinoplanes utahensis]